MISLFVCFKIEEKKKKKLSTIFYSVEPIKESWDSFYVEKVALGIVLTAFVLLLI